MEGVISYQRAVSLCRMKAKTVRDPQIRESILKDLEYYQSKIRK